MKVIITTPDLSYANPSLSGPMIEMYDEIVRAVEEYKNYSDARTLVVVMACQCCKSIPEMGIKNAVFVTPLHGASFDDNVKVIKKYPPNSDMPEAAHDAEEFIEEFRLLLKEALR